MTTMLEAALVYASRGVRVFPCHWPIRGGKCSCSDPECSSPGKHPRTEHGFLDATTDEDRIREWWSSAPHANIATPTGTTDGFDVLDVDPRNGGEESLQALRELGELPMTLITRTGGDGLHDYFQAAHRGLSSRPFLPGLDWKTMGGYVLLPPSRHVSGKTYRWDNGVELGA
ncbi:MAG: bifunctional DNA primase/polymerase, partial [Vicinamibacteria bacterium]